MTLVERDELVSAIAAAWTAARNGRGSIVGVSGEAGLGKTSVVRAAFPGRSAVWGFCEPLSTARPLGPFRDASATLWGTDESADPREKLLEWLRGEPVPLVIEDAHWIDEASAELLRFLGRRIEFTRGLVVLTFRDELAPGHPLQRLLGDLASARTIQRLPLTPLSVEGVAQLTGNADDSVEVHRLTNGNPFLVAELSRSNDGRISPNLADEVAARVARLTPPARDVVEFLSILPGRTHSRVLEADWSQLDEAVIAGIVEVEEAYVGFRHELVRLAIRDGLKPARAVALHREALQRVLRQPHHEPAEVAYHARRSHDLTIAFDADRAAGRRAVELRSHQEAAEHFRRAIEDPPPHTANSTIAEVLLQLAEVEFLAGRGNAAHAAAERAVALCPAERDPRLRGAALCWLSRTTTAEQSAHGFAREAVALLEPLGPTPELAAASARLAMSHMLARELTEARHQARHSIALADQLGDTASLVVALQALGCVEIFEGADAAALHRAIRLADEAQLHTLLGQAHANLVSATGEARRYGESAAAADDALRYFLAQDHDYYADYTRAWQARCQFEQGRWSLATAGVDVMLGGPSAPESIVAIIAHTLRGRVRARRGDPDVWPALDTAKEIADRTGSLQRLAPVAAARAEASWLTGRADDGRTGLTNAYELAMARSSPWAVGELGLWMWRHGLIAAIPDTAAEPYVLQVSGQPEAAGAAWAELGCPYESADAWCDSEDPTTVRRALEVFSELGAAPGRQRAARQLRRLGVRTVPRGPRSTTAADPDGLTRREQEVLGWIRGGYTDSEIAARLHLSVKTVEHHVSAVLRKTGSRSRRDLQTRGEVEPT